MSAASAAGWAFAAWRGSSPSPRSKVARQQEDMRQEGASPYRRAAFGDVGEPAHGCGLWEARHVEWSIGKRVRLCEKILVSNRV